MEAVAGLGLRQRGTKQPAAWLGEESECGPRARRVPERKVPETCIGVFGPKDPSVHVSVDPNESEGRCPNH